MRASERRRAEFLEGFRKRLAAEVRDRLEVLGSRMQMLDLQTHAALEADPSVVRDLLVCLAGVNGLIAVFEVALEHAADEPHEEHEGSDYGIRFCSCGGVGVVDSLERVRTHGAAEGNILALLGRTGQVQGGLPLREIYFVRCERCKVWGPRAGNASKAVEIWNFIRENA